MINKPHKWLTKPKKVFSNTQIVTLNFSVVGIVFQENVQTPEICRIPADGFSFEESLSGYDQGCKKHDHRPNFPSHPKG